MKRFFLIILITIAGMTELRAQMLVVNTELSSDLMMAPSLGVEIVTGEYSSIGVNALYGKKILGKDISITAVQPEYRYWFSGRPIHNWFIGVGGIGVLFDVKWKRKVYDGYGFGLGLTFGYVWNLKLGKDKRLNLDFHAGFGGIYYNRKEYFENDNYDVDYTIDGQVRANASGYYLLPTRIGISVSYILM